MTLSRRGQEHVGRNEDDMVDMSDDHKDLLEIMTKTEK